MNVCVLHLTLLSPIVEELLSRIPFLESHVMETSRFMPRYCAQYVTSCFCGQFRICHALLLGSVTSKLKLLPPLL
jgi:hypothetical protein